jgi:hypothetical protein
MGENGCKQRLPPSEMEESHLARGVSAAASPATAHARKGNLRAHSDGRMQIAVTGKLPLQTGA